MPCSSGRTRAAPVTAFTQQGVALATPSTAKLAAITSFPRYDRNSGAQWLGKDVSAGWGLSSASWFSDIKRYGRHLTGASLNQEVYNAAIEPRAFVDPSIGPSGTLIRIADMMRASFAGAVSGNPARASLMIGQPFETSANTIPPAKIGFQAVYNVLNVQPSWSAYYSNFDGSVRQVIDTGLRCDIARYLVLELDGVLQQIRWYIDNVLVATFNAPAGTAPGQNATTRAFPIIWHTYGGASGGTSLLDFLLGGVPLVSVQASDT